MSVDDDEKELRDLCQRLQDGKRTSKGGGEQGASEEDDVRSNGRRDDGRDGEGANAEGQAFLQIPQPQPQGAMVCWERFLHIRSLKVLLVEYDDSTRHVVAALLRNCSYEVIEGANGLQAWKILEDLNNHIDLVLTEVAMPCLSGIGLLCKIMSHKTRKNIPVIMMSSHDSMGLVFKCLSKGAVDFLVKPIRKNELKNLWQHVWRRCHSSSGSGSGSGSESGTQTQKSVKSKSLENFENSGSNDEDEDGSTGLNVGDGSDNGSGTQNSWTKQDVEVDSSRPASAWDHIPECPDSTCAQVVHSMAEISGNMVLPVVTIKKGQDQKEQLEVKTGGGKDLDLLECRNDVPVRNAGAKHGGLVEMRSSKLNELMKREKLDISCEHVSSNLRSKGILMDGLTTDSNQQLLSGELEASNWLCKVSNVDNKPSNMDEGLSLELSLKRLRGVKDFGTAAPEDRNVLRRSDLSAFSRYNAASSKSPAGCVRSSTPHCDSSHDMQSHSGGNHLNQNSNGASNNIDMGSITNNAYSKTAVVSEQALASTSKGLYPTSAFQVIKNNSLSSTQQVVLRNTDDILETASIKGGLQRDDPPQQFHHHFDSHRHCHLPNNVQKTEHPGVDDVPLTNTSAAPLCGSSNALEVVDGNVGYSVNGSATGSNNGSNGQNILLNAGGTNRESNNRFAGNSGSGDASGSGSANRGDQNKTSQREATLNKFRQKRKERCFRKKVRYQSRKRLAEQRPRFRGQFVRQSPTGSESKTRDS